MKLNNKGFAISTIMYIILVMAIILITLTLSVLNNRKLILDKTKEEAKDNIYFDMPRGYQLLEFLRISNNEDVGAFVNIEYFPTNNTSIYLDFAFKTSSSTSTYIPILAERNKPFGEAMYGIWVNRITGNVAYNFGNKDTSDIEGTNVFGRHIYQNIKNKFYIDGNLVTEIETGSFVSSIPLSLFALHTYENGELVYENRELTGEFYSLKIYEQEILIKNFVPCQDKDTNQKGICDLLDFHFYPLNTNI